MADTPTPAAVPRRRRWPWWLAAALLVLLPLVVAGTVGAAWRALHTEAGTRWWLARVTAYVPGLTLVAPRGALLGADATFRLDRLRYAAGGTTVELQTLAIDGLRIDRWQWRAPHVHVQARALTAERAAVALEPAPPEAPRNAPPTRLRFPAAVHVESLRIDALHLPGLNVPVQALQARLASDEQHRIDRFSLRWNGLRAEGETTLGAEAPLPLAAALSLGPDPEAGPDAPLPDWARDFALALQADGPLARFDAQARLAMQDQQLHAEARVTPFEPLPVAQLDARFTELDLARLLAPLGLPAPATVLSGSTQLQLDTDQPLRLQAQITNTRPGRWDAARLPLRELALRAQGRGGDWTLDEARAEFASDERSAAGRLEGSGRFEGGAGRAELRLIDLTLPALDQRAPPLRLNGPLNLEHTPPSPDRPTAFGQLGFEATLSGSLIGEARTRAPAPLRDAVRLALRGSASPETAELARIEARAGAARLEGRAAARRHGDAWDSDADLKLTDFDPALWLPGEPGQSWRRAGNALNGSARLQARLPDGAADPAARLAALSGKLNADFAGSRLAGQAFALQLEAEADGNGQLSARGEARAADNEARVTLALRAPGRAANTGNERLEARIDAPALERLAPLAQAFGLDALAGQVRLDAQAEGALGAWWFGGSGGALSTRGDLALTRLHAGSLRVDEASGRWEATLPGSRSDAAGLGRARLDAGLQARDLQVPGLVLPSLELQAEGSLAEHRARLAATMRTPADTSDGAPPPPAPLALTAALTGAWQAGSPMASWQARIEELALRPTSDARLPATLPPGLALLVARDLRLRLDHGEQQLSFALEPGTAELLGAALRWQQARWERTAGAEPRLDVQATIEPFLVAQLLQRLQPDFGWTGDLRVGALVELRSRPEVSARIEIARTGGDLQVSEFGNVQSLGLSEARLALQAEDGRWEATQRIVGANLGRIVGRQTLRTDPTHMWPPDDAPIEGQIAAAVENLSAWGAWVPAGWRLGGQLDAALRVAGRLGAPELIGEASGRQLELRNALEGVALREGEFQARFDGSTARLERLHWRAGEGTLQAEGQARLGAEPQAEITLQAERALLLGRVDRRVVASGSARLQLDAQKLSVTGRVRADEGLVDISRGDAPTLGDDVTVRRRSAETDEQAPAAQRPTEREVDLDLLVDLGPRFQMRGRGLRARLAGELRLTAPNGRLTARGEIRTEDGRYEAYGQDLSIERGVITFVGEIANPRLDIEAVRANSDTRVGVRVAGNAQSPRVTLFSDPELPATEKLALLVTGRSYDSLAGGDTLLLQRAAFALLAGDGDNSAFDVAGLLQLDELSVRQTDGAVRETVVTLGKQISDRVYLGYERGLNAAAGNWQLIYRIAQRFTLRAQSGQDPAIDLIWLFRWN